MRGRLKVGGGSWQVAGGKNRWKRKTIKVILLRLEKLGQRRAPG